MLTLVAASDPALRAALADAVCAAGHEVVCAADGAAAWAAYQERRPPLVVVDVGLAPGGPGAPDALALCGRVHATAHGELPNGELPNGELPNGDLPNGALPNDDRPDVVPAGGLGTDVRDDVGAGEEGDDAPGPFVIVTVPRDGTADLQGALAAGADDYFTTPPSPRNVAARLAIAERRMETKAARRRAEHALWRARWVAGIGETSIALQHEINNPLAALLGHAALLEQGLVAPGEERELLQIVVEQAQRIASVMRRLAALRDPRSVEYFGVARMLDLSTPLGAPTTPAAGMPAAGTPASDAAAANPPPTDAPPMDSLPTTSLPTMSPPTM